MCNKRVTSVNMLCWRYYDSSNVLFAPGSKKNSEVLLKKVNKAANNKGLDAEKSGFSVY